VHQGLGFQIALTSSEGGALQRRILADWETEEERAGDYTCSGVVFIIVCTTPIVIEGELVAAAVNNALQ
jgi:hypothetical protein